MISHQKAAKNLKKSEREKTYNFTGKNKHVISREFPAVNPSS